MTEELLVLGAAISGGAAARLGLRLGYAVTVYDRDPEMLDRLDLDVVKAGGDWRPELLDGAAMIVTSPGIPPGAPPLADALAGAAPVVSELEFGSRQLDAPYVAVTGTNGKTTVAEAAAAMMTADGLRACAAGNVGLAVSDIALDPWDAVAIEASSFQLTLIDKFHPVAAAILNVAPDHLDWHGSFESYLSAKVRITENQTASDVLIADPDDDVVTAALEGTPAFRVPVSGRYRPDQGNGPDGDVLVIGDESFPKPALDDVWLYDLAVAATLASAVGVGPQGIAHVLAHFEPGQHRRQLVAVADGVAWVNDSKATNPHAAAAAAGTYPSVILIAGGRNKGLDLAPLLEVPTVRHIVALGEAAADLGAIGGARVTVVAGMREAVEQSARLAVAGDTVLLAPGCASFDMFPSYAARGEAFIRLVAEHTGQRSGNPV